MSQPDPSLVSPAPPDQLQLPARVSEEKSPSRGWTHQELLPLIQNDSKHDELNQLLGRLTPEERAKLLEHRFKQAVLLIVSDVPAQMPAGIVGMNHLDCSRICSVQGNSPHSIHCMRRLSGSSHHPASTVAARVPCKH